MEPANGASPGADSFPSDCARNSTVIGTGGGEEGGREGVKEDPVTETLDPHSKLTDEARLDGGCATKVRFRKHEAPG